MVLGVLALTACPDDSSAVDAASGQDAAVVDSAAGDIGSPDSTGTPDAAVTADGATRPDGAVGADGSMQVDGGTIADAAQPGGQYFPSTSFMYQDVSQAALDPNSSAITRWLADNGGWGFSRFQIDFSIEVLEAESSTPYVTLDYDPDWLPDCDTLDFPIPAGGRLEGETGYSCASAGDCHLIVADRRVNRLYEMWQADYTGGVLSGTCEAVWDMTRVYPAEGRGEQCTSADAAGFPIAPLLFTADEVAAGEIAHAIRFILPNARMRADWYVHPATHAGGPSASSADAPTYGTRWRLKSDFDVSGYSAGAQVVARALKKYGMLLADGGNVALTAQADTFTTAKWDSLLGSHDLVGIEPTDFEVVATDPPIALTYDCVRTPESW